MPGEGAKAEQQVSSAGTLEIRCRDCKRRRVAISGATMRTPSPKRSTSARLSDEVRGSPGFARNQLEHGPAGAAGVHPDRVDADSKPDQLRKIIQKIVVVRFSVREK